MKSYLSPQMEIIEIDLAAVICQSPGGTTLTNYGEGGAAGGTINDDNYVEGGIF